MFCACLLSGSQFDVFALVAALQHGSLEFCTPEVEAAKAAFKEKHIYSYMMSEIRARQPFEAWMARWDDMMAAAGSRDGPGSEGVHIPKSERKGTVVNTRGGDATWLRVILDTRRGPALKDPRGEL